MEIQLLFTTTRRNTGLGQDAFSTSWNRGKSDLIQKKMSYCESFWQDGLLSEGSISHSEILTTLLERRHSLAQPAASRPDLSIRLDVKIFGSSI